MLETDLPEPSFLACYGCHFRNAPIQSSFCLIPAKFPARCKNFLSSKASIENMQNGIIVRVFIASPGDVHLEREEACRVIQEWNAAHSLPRSVIVEPIRVETHSRAVQGGHPQDLINAQLLERCDLLVAILWSRLGTPTAKALSGTVQEIHEFSETKGDDKVLLFFCDRPIPNAADLEQVQAVRSFKDSVKTDGLYLQYTEAEEFARLFRQQLDLTMNAILDSNEFAVITAESDRRDVTLLPEACSILAVASVADSSRILLSRMRAGHELSVGGICLTNTGDERSEAKWEGGLEQLEQCGFAEDLGYKREVFRLTRSGYEAADELWHILLLRRVNSLQQGEYDYVDVSSLAEDAFNGCRIAVPIVREKVNALGEIEALELVAGDGGTTAVRLNDKSRKTLREHEWLKFANPDGG
ncbi:DUF4062 domain-containing protein [Stieleria sp. ICT_E10.1]|uniref:DUF4062 domain-containing protein n=1 Tax=Stieleria sedimenti TaxID=2976331 RepID=UPI0021804E60|nr:DUF4062 domain-containing protein [Stieleria sedimenti]MCS7466361.1 DUF4062 domain-containing protein [Stieleria sedimenti]